MKKRTKMLTVRLSKAELVAVRNEADRRNVAVAVIVREALLCNTRKTPAKPCTPATE